VKRQPTEWEEYSQIIYMTTCQFQNIQGTKKKNPIAKKKSKNKIHKNQITLLKMGNRPK
jgi:hypothetical protein